LFYDFGTYGGKLYAVVKADHEDAGQAIDFTDPKKNDLRPLLSMTHQEANGTPIKPYDMNTVMDTLRGYAISNQLEAKPKVAGQAPQGQAGSSDPGGRYVPDDGDADRLVGLELLDAVSAHLQRHVIFMTADDADYLALWALHTHVGLKLGTTPRLCLNSPMPGAGKTTCLDHLKRLCFAPMLAANATPAAIAAATADGPVTILLDEVDRMLRPDSAVAPDLLSTINSGYRVGSSKTIRVPDGNGGWVNREMPSFGYVAMAGNSPKLPDDTLSRSYEVMLYPDEAGRAEDSVWEDQEFTEKVDRLGKWLHLWADEISIPTRNEVKLPDGCNGRFREKWLPLVRLATAAGGRWVDLVYNLTEDDIDSVRRDREDGLMDSRPHILLVKDILALWPENQEFWSTQSMVPTLKLNEPDRWGSSGSFPTGLTDVRVARMLKGFKIRPVRENSDKNSKRGYRRSDFDRARGLVGNAA
jgi:hypothetical protein